MDWIKSFQRSIDFIEENLSDTLETERIAGVMNVSPFYYQRIFAMLCGITVGEYIRNRRLSLAGSDLLRSDGRIIDIALKYGYDTPEGFSRAFARFHGASPSEVRKGAPVRSFARLSVAITMKGGNSMDYKIVKKGAFKVIEKRTVQTVSENKNLQTIPKFWEDSQKDGTIKRLLEIAVGKEFIFGICYNNPHTEEVTFDYSIAVLADAGAEAPEGFSVNEIPARTWAVFECRGAMPDAIQQLWHRICSEFFPSSGYEPTCEFDIEVYTDGDMSAPDYRSEIWVPIKTDCR
ncbi:MAG: AraC family transcriptional regulator [Oscillospiraceae bacterium]|nr:AraC family transcriptional regulator [Oscillospiraceae bacterium]